MMRRRFGGRAAGFVLALVGYLLVSVQSISHGYAHLDLAHHAAEHALLGDGIDATSHSFNDGGTLHKTIPSVDADEDSPNHGHVIVGDGVAAKIVSQFLIAARPLSLDESHTLVTRTAPRAVDEPIPRRSLPTTAPPRLRAPPVS